MLPLAVGRHRLGCGDAEALVGGSTPLQILRATGEARPEHVRGLDPKVRPTMAAPLAPGEAQQGGTRAARSRESSAGLWALHLDGQHLWAWLRSGVVQAWRGSVPAVRGRSGTSAKPGPGDGASAKRWPSLMPSVGQESYALAAHASCDGFARCDLAEGDASQDVGPPRSACVQRHALSHTRPASSSAVTWTLQWYSRKKLLLLGAAEPKLLQVAARIERGGFFQAARLSSLKVGGCAAMMVFGFLQGEAG